MLFIEAGGGDLRRDSLFFIERTAGRKAASARA